MALPTALLALVGGLPIPGPAIHAPAVGTQINIVAAANARAARAERRLDDERSKRLSGSGTRITSGFIESIDQNPELRGAKWYGAPGSPGIAQKMMKDLHVRQSLADVYEPLLAGTWRFKPASSSAIDREIADFLTWCLIDSLLWHEATKRIVLDYGQNGFALAELTDASRPIPADRFPLHPGGGFGVVPTGIHQVPGWTVYQWQQSKTSSSQIAGVVQQLGGSDAEALGWPTIPADRLLRWTWDQDGANFEGFAILRSAYAPWKMKIAFQTLASMKHERLALPVPVAIAPEVATDDDIDAVETILKEMRANARGYLVLDNGWSFKWEGATASDGSNIEAAISQCNQDIAFNVSAAFMLLGLTGKSGSYALGATQQGKYHLAELSHARFIAAGWNLGYDGWSPVKRIVQLNYGDSVSIPTLVVRNLPTANWADRIPLMINAANVGLVRRDGRTENAIREALEFDDFDPDTELPARAPTATLPTREQRNQEHPAEPDQDEEQAA